MFVQETGINYHQQIILDPFHTRTSDIVRDSSLVELRLTALQNTFSCSFFCTCFF